MDYVAGQYSVSKIDTPLRGTVLTFSDRQDFLALAVEFTTNDVITEVLDMDNKLTERIMGGELTEEEMSASDNEVLCSVCRIFSVMKRGVPSDFIRKNAMREVIYYTLCGSCGRQLIQSIANIGNADEIYEVNSWIKENFRESFSVETLARSRHMSVSSFHQKFKSAVGMGPLQCQKRLRLTEARRLMLDEGKTVTQAASDVGYDSISQFNKDYKKCLRKLLPLTLSR